MPKKYGGKGGQKRCFCIHFPSSHYKTNMALDKGVGWLGNSFLLIIWDGLFSAAMFELGRVFILIDKKDGCIDPNPFKWRRYSTPGAKIQQDFSH